MQTVSTAEDRQHAEKQRKQAARRKTAEVTGLTAKVWKRRDKHTARCPLIILTL